MLLQVRSSQSLDTEPSFMSARLRRGSEQPLRASAFFDLDLVCKHQKFNLRDAY